MDMCLKSDFNFGHALICLKDGKKLSRTSWNDKNSFIYLVPASNFKVNRPPLNTFYSEGTEIQYNFHIDMKCSDGSCIPWTASQSDLLSDDWYIVD